MDSTSVLSQIDPNSVNQQNADIFARAQGLQNNQAMQPQQQGDWLTRALPTIGSIALPVLGALLAPGTGGASLLAASALGAAGGAAGKAAENYATHQNVTSGLGGAAAEGGIGNLVGGVIGKGVSKLLPAVAGKATTAGADLIQGQVPRGYLNDAEAQALQKMGITDVRQAPQIFEHVSGANGALPNTVKNTLAQQGGVDITGLDEVARNSAAAQNLTKQSSINNINAAMDNAVNHSIPGEVSQIPAKGGMMTNTYDIGALQNALPENVFKQAQGLENLASTAYSKGFDKFTGQVTDPEQAGMYRVYRDMANHLESKAFGGDSPIPLGNDVKQSIINQLAPVKDINPTAYNSYVEQINNAKNLQDLRPMQSLIVRARNAVVGGAAKEGNAAGATAASVAKGVGAPLSLALSHPGVALGSLMLSSPAADRAGASVLTKLGEKVGTKQAGKIAETLSRAGGAAVATSPQLEPTVSANNITTGGIPQQGATTAMNQQPTAGMPLQDYINAMEAQSVLAPALNPNATGFMSGAFPQLQQNALTSSLMGGAGGSFGLAGGAQGTGGGLLSRISGLIPGTAANSYQGSSALIAAQLAKQLGISPQEAMNILPQLMQNQGVAQQRQGVLGSLSGALVQ